MSRFFLFLYAFVLRGGHVGYEFRPGAELEFRGEPDTAETRFSGYVRQEEIAVATQVERLPSPLERRWRRGCHTPRLL